MRRFLNSFSNYIDKLVKITIMIFLAVMVFVVFMQVFFRFIIENPLQWSEELSRYLFVWISFLGASLALKRGQHLGIDVFLKIFPRKLSKIFVIISYLLILIFLILICIKGVNLLQVVKNQKSASLRISMIYPYSGVFIGLLLMIINSINIILEMLFSNKLDEIIDGKIEDYEIDGNIEKYRE